TKGGLPRQYAGNGSTHIHALGRSARAGDGNTAGWIRRNAELASPKLGAIGVKLADKSVVAAPRKGLARQCAAGASDHGDTIGPGAQSRTVVKRWRTELLGPQQVAVDVILLHKGPRNRKGSGPAMR